MNVESLVITKMYSENMETTVLCSNMPSSFPPTRDPLCVTILKLCGPVVMISPLTFVRIRGAGPRSENSNNRNLFVWALSNSGEWEVLHQRYTTRLCMRLERKLCSPTPLSSFFKELRVYCCAWAGPLLDITWVLVVRCRMCPSSALTNARHVVPVPVRPAFDAHASISG